MPVPYAADNSAGSNLGPTSKALVDRVKGDAETLAKENPRHADPVRSGHHVGERSGPRHHTGRRAVPGAARVGQGLPQGLADDKVRQLVEDHVTGRLLGIIGEPHVNVLKLNLALDAMNG